MIVNWILISNFSSTRGLYMMTDTRAAYHKASVLLSHNCVWLLIPNLDPDYYSLHSMLTTRGLFMVTEWWLLGEPPPWARRNYFAQNITNFVMSVPYYLAMTSVEITANHTTISTT